MLEAAEVWAESHRYQRYVFVAIGEEIQVPSAAVSFAPEETVVPPEIVTGAEFVGVIEIACAVELANLVTVPTLLVRVTPTERYFPAWLVAGINITLSAPLTARQPNPVSEVALVTALVHEYHW
jgi:hypothetical protein